MQDGIEHIIAEYQAADFEKRLSMFMTYIELRCQFMEIDSNSSSDKKTMNDTFLDSVCCFGPVINRVKSIFGIYQVK